MVAGLFGRRIGDFASQAVTTGFLILSCLLSWTIFAQWTWGGLEPFTLQIAPFIHVGDFQSNWSLRLDGLSAVMLIVVTTVSAWSTSTAGATWPRIRRVRGSSPTSRSSPSPCCPW